MPGLGLQPSVIAPAGNKPKRIEVLPETVHRDP
jgi:hypothetical protein